MKLKYDEKIRDDKSITEYKDGGIKWRPE